MTKINALNISASALSANKMKLDIISQNIANAETIRTETNEPYKRKIATVGPDDSFINYLDTEKMKLDLKGVKISSVNEDESPFKLVYDPDNPYANEEGYILKSNVDITEEMLDLLSISRAYEANMTVFNSTKDMLVKTLKIAD
ncbi:MAG: flagellar basal body rod protein FlgC [Clostridia bacterium]|nr:flagellar basal body rod protein FlgC [Clostridia bacterium]